ncbi:hypothetical protein JHK87_035115 [Glycine soja]|nr:hypothetical protein JHK87_035115 [Glycine soja]
MRDEDRDKWGRITFMSPNVVKRAAELDGHEFCGSSLKVVPSQLGGDKIKSCNPQTFGSILSMAASRVELKLGRCLHGQILRATFYLDAHVETSLIVMYLKGGKIDIAFRMFEIWSEAISWHYGQCNHNLCTVEFLWVSRDLSLQLQNMTEVSTKNTYMETQSYNEDMKLTSNPTPTMAARLSYSMVATMGLKSPRVPQSLHQKPKKVLRLTKGSRNSPSYSIEQHR